MSLADYPPRADRTPLNERTLGDIIREALPTANLQILPECTLQVQTCKNPRGASRVTFLTDNMTPNEALYPSTARSVGVVVWVPIDIYLGRTQEPR